MKVSVIVMTYNQEDTIARTLDSILAQCDCPPFEIIIGDDASSDGTRSICEDYVRKFPGIVRLMPPAPNKGVVDNYFDCLLASTGIYVSDCSGDDSWIDCHKLSREVQALEAHPEATVAYSDWIIENGETGESVVASALPQYKRLEEDNRPMLVKILDHTNALPYNLSASTYRKDALMEVYEKCPGAVRNRLFGFEDVPVMAALASKGSAVKVEAVTFRYTIGRETVSHSDSLVREAKFYVKSLYTSHYLAGFYGVPLTSLHAVYRSKLKFISSAAFRSGDPELCRDVENIIAAWPFTPDLKTTVRRLIMKAGLGKQLLRICKKFRIFAV